MVEDTFLASSLLLQSCFFLQRLYRSWAEMLRSQPANWRTDFLIFTYNFSADYRSLGCINRIRQSKEEPSICRLFLYVPIQFRTKNITENKYAHAFDQAKKVAEQYKDNPQEIVTVPTVDDPTTYDSQRSELLYTVLRDYGYIDSINTLYEGYNTFKMYDFVMRTDIGKMKGEKRTIGEKSSVFRCFYLSTFR